MDSFLLKYFHDAGKYGVEPTEVAKARKDDKWIQDGRRLEKNNLPPNIARIKAVINQIENYKIKNDPSITNRAEQEMELANRVAIVRKMLDKVFSCSAEYLAAVTEHDYIASNPNPEDSIAKKMLKLSGRGVAHNQLISAVNTALEYIKTNFGILSPEEEMQFKLLQEDDGDVLLDIDRSDFEHPSTDDSTVIESCTNWFLPNWVDLDDRSTIGEWAAKVAEDMKSIKTAKIKK